MAKETKHLEQQEESEREQGRLMQKFIERFTAKHAKLFPQGRRSEASAEVKITVAEMLEDAKGEANRDDDADDAKEAEELRAFQEWFEKENPGEAEAIEPEGIAMSSERRKPFRMSLAEAKAAVSSRSGVDLSKYPESVLEREKRSAFERGDVPTLFAIFKVDPKRLADEVLNRGRFQQRTREHVV
jgi:hypothetical protein